MPKIALKTPCNPLKITPFTITQRFALFVFPPIVFEFNGPLDMDFFIKDGKYYLSEINPRFGGAYLHAYGAGVDFIKLIVNNINGIENPVHLGGYDDDVLMLMYDDVVIAKASDLVNRDFSTI